MNFTDVKLAVFLFCWLYLIYKIKLYQAFFIQLRQYNIIIRPALLYPPKIILLLEFCAKSTMKNDGSLAWSRSFWNSCKSKSAVKNDAWQSAGMGKSNCHINYLLTEDIQQVMQWFWMFLSLLPLGERVQIMKWVWCSWVDICPHHKTTP